MVGKAQGKKGEGLKKYADEIGKSCDSLEQWTKAAMVYVELTDTCRELQDKPRHLYEISKAPQITWQGLADLLIECDWSVKDIKSAHTTTHSDTGKQ